MWLVHRSVEDAQALDDIYMGSLFSRGNVAKLRFVVVVAPPPPDSVRRSLLEAQHVPHPPQAPRVPWLAGVCWSREAFAEDALIIQNIFSTTAFRFMYATQNPMMAISGPSVM